MRSKHISVTAFVLLWLLTSLASAQQQRRIVRPIDNSSTVRLTGTIQPRIRNATDRGPVSPALPLQRMTMVFSPSQQQQSALDQLLAAQQDPNSANYHKWLTPEEFADRFGLAQSDVDVVSAWLTSQGFTVDEVARGRNWIAFSGIAAQVEAAFHAPIHIYAVGGKTHFAASTDISVPDAFAGIVSGVTGLHDFAPSPRIVKANPHVTSSITGNHFIVPGDFATLYNLPSYTNGVPCTSPCLDGTGQSIAIVGQTDLSTDTNPGRNGTPGANGQQYDLVTFRNLAGLPPVNLQIVVNGSDPGLQTSDADEANLDVEWSGGAAPNAKLIYVITSALQNGQGAFGSLVYAVNNNLAPIITVSYGLCENPQFLDTNTYNQLTQAGIQANAQGQAIVAASGDSGAADCDSNLPATNGISVDFPGSMPYSTSIGGTTFTGDTTNPTAPTQSTQYWAGSTNDVAPSAFSYIPETAWNDSSGLSTGTISATGGGASIKYSKPTWQTGPGVPADGARDVPDVSFNASPSHDETVICSQSSCVNNYRNTDTTYDVIGGTSLGAPTFAGILALINQAKGGPQGNINPQLYSLVQSYPLPGDSNTSWAYNDITTGNNIVVCAITQANGNCPNGQIGYSAGPGYDQVTGLGSVDATALIDALTNSPNPHFLVLPASRSVSLSPSSSSAVAVSVTPKEGFTGTIALTCTVSSSLVGATCSYDNSSVSTPGSANLTIQTASGQSLQSGTVTVTGTSGSTTDSVVIGVNPPDFTIAATGTTETVSPGGSTTDTITITPLQGMTGQVSFICTGTTGITCSLGTNPVTITSTSAVTSTLTVNASSGAATGSLNIVATSGTLIHSLPIPVTVNTTAPDFTLTVASPVVSITSGGVITDNLTIASVGGFSSDVAFTCSVPSSLGTTTCAINPSTVAGGSGTAVVTITGAVLTKDRGAPLPFQHRGLGAYATFVFALGMVFTAKPKRGCPTQASFAWVRLVRKGLLALLLLSIMFGALSCGGGGSGGSNGSGPTPLNGNVTITGVGGGITQTITINVTVT